MRAPTLKRPVSQLAGPPASFWSRQDWLFGVLLVVAIMIAYAPALRAGFIWDDDSYVTENPLLTAPDGLRRIWFSFDSPSQYFPLTYTTFFVERGLWGLNPAGYHLVNLLLHAANALLVWFVLARLRVPGAWLAAAIFALHPVQVESVAWITERKNVLMGFFFLLTLWAWLKFINDSSGRPWRFYILVLVFYGLALFAKTTACTLPAALLLILWLRKTPINWRRLGQVAPFVVMGIGMGLLTVWWERHHQGTQGKLFEIGPVERVLIASRALWFYMGKLLWPARLTFSYPRWTISASDPRAYAWLLATAALGVVIWRARRWAGRSVEVAAIFFAATLSPVLGFIMLFTFLFSFVADHYQYMACIGPIALAAAGMKLGLDWFAAGKRFLQLGLCAALLLILGTLTWRQCGMYASAETLWQTTLRQNPNCWLAHLNLGMIFLNKGQLDEATAQFQKTVEIKPDYAKAHYDLGTAFLQKGDVDDAITEYQNSLQIDPDHAEAHLNLANLLAQKGRADEAIGHFQKALQIAPDNPIMQNGLAWFLATCPKASLRDGKKAVVLAQQANALMRGKNPMIFHTLAAAFAETGQFGDATSSIKKAIELARAAGRVDMEEQFNGELKHYESGLPLHQ